MDTLLERAEEIKQPKRRQSLIDNVDQIRTSRELVKLDDAMDMDVDFEDLELRDPEPDTLLPFLAEMEFRTLTNRVAGKLGVESPEIEIKEPEGAATPEMPDIDPSAYEWVKDADALNAWVDRIMARGYVAFDTETTGLDEMRVDLVGISLAVEPGEACYIPLIHKTSQTDDLFGGTDLAEGQMALDDVLSILKPVLEDPAILKIGQNMKYDAKIMARYGVSVAPIDDTMLMSYAQNAGLHNHGMDTSV